MERKEFKQVFNQRLDEFLDEKIDNLRPYFFDEKLEKMITYLKQYVDGGKRFRPYLVFLFYKLMGGNKSDILDIILSVELIHIFALIHDDIADKGTQRHGIDTYHIYTSKLVGDEHWGMSQAMIVGDLVYTWSLKNFNMNVEEKYPKKVFFEMLEEVTYGQIIDLHLSYSQDISSSQMIKFKDKRKSGYYSFKRPMMLGSALAGQIDLSAVEELGEDLGLAFQMRDDLLDIVDGHGNKTPFSDHQEGNQTFLLHHALEAASESEKKLILETRGTTCDDETIQKLREIYKNTGTIKLAQEKVNGLLDESSQRLEKLVAKDDSLKKYIKFIIDYLRV